MKDTTFNMFVGIIVGCFVGAAVVGISTQATSGSDRKLVVSRPNGTTQTIKMYRSDDCRRWGEVIMLTVDQPGFNYTCGNSG